jgi:hypothetical protein
VTRTSSFLVFGYLFYFVKFKKINLNYIKISWMYGKLLMFNHWFSWKYQYYIVKLTKMLTNLYPSIYWMKLELIDSAINYPWVEHSSGTIPMPTWITFVFDQQHTVRWTEKKTRRHHKEIVLSTCIYLHFITIIKK